MTENKNNNCEEIGHQWEVVETYQANETEIGIIYKCLECDKEVIDHSIIIEETNI